MMTTEENFSYSRTAPNAWSVDPGLLITFAAMAVVAGFLLYRTMGLFPFVMADEWAYNLFSRHLPFSAAPMPSYLYFWIFRQTRHCSGSYMECVRLFNCLIFVAAAPFIYKICRQIATPSISALIALAAICCPVNTYTNFFMPEATYFTGFWILSWFLLTRRNHGPALYGFLTGLFVACLSMVKVHAVFLFPAVLLFLVACAYRSESPARWRRLAATVTFLFIGFVAVRFPLGYAFAGRAGLHVLGNLYGGIADTSLNISSLVQFTRLVPFSLAGHIMVIALLFGVPLAASFVWEFSPRDSSGDDSLFLIKFYALAVIASLLVIAAYYNVSVVGHPHESIHRLPVRYYNFALPLLLVVAAGEMSSRRPRLPPYLALPPAVVIGVFAVCSLWLLRSKYTPNVVDSPEAQGLVSNIGALYVIGLLAVTTLIVWVVNRRWGAGLFLFVFLPIALWTSSLYLTRDLRSHLQPDAYEKAGLFVHYSLDPEDRSSVLAVGSEEGRLYETLFQIDDPKTKMLLISDGESLKATKIGPDVDWVLLVGDHQPPEGAKVQYLGDGYMLFRQSDQLAIHFSRYSLGGVVRHVSGLSGREPIGRWSDAGHVEIELSSPLPHNFRLTLAAGAFGPNVNLPFVVRIGSETQTLRLPGNIVDVSLPFVTDGNQRTIVIEVPKPTAPADIGLNQDVRHLGILLKEMVIVPSDEGSK